ncbi:hypothetical protein EDB80DRAFT_642220 [Ilyonectria destructans]|nr:hypothetical protein EDB80DRAFT_642220 [Ilyonectria destructans]
MSDRETEAESAGQPTSSTKDARRPPKRVMTAARKEQNRVAQKAYRQRQRERRQTLRADNRKWDNKLPLLAGSSGHCPATTTNDDVWATDVTSSDAGALSLSGTTSSEVSPLLPCLNRKSLRLVPTFIVSAVFENALSLDYDLARLAECRGDYISPFYEPLASPQNDPEALIASAIARVTPSSCNRTIPVHLRPTLAQILIPHDASLDLIPLPFLRERAIMLVAVMPETFNMWELKFDIYHRGGLIIWQQDRSGQEGSSACTSYQPWDMRSWEATPWFLQKWCMVVGGKDSPFWKQSTWWRSLRGVEHG